MSFRPLLRTRPIAPAAAALAGVSLALFPKTTLFAETADGSPPKKPIYDDPEASTPAPKTSPTKPSAMPSVPKPSGPTPTDRLAVQIGKTRVFLHAHVAAAESRVNSAMDSAFHLENSFTSTIASLAPSPESGEKLMPGSLYVLVAAMTGSIITRNRNILLRGAFPVAVGIGAGWVVLPATMQNISELLWTYEEKFPAVADAHIRARNGIQRAWQGAKVHTKMAVDTVDEKIGEGRQAVEGWVRKGK